MDAAFQEAWNRQHHLGEALRPAELVVANGRVRVERDLQARVEADQRLEPLEQARREQGGVRERNRRQEPGDLDERLGEPREHEDLAARDTAAGEPEVAGGGDGVEHRLGRERSPARDPGRAFGEAVDAGQVAVIRRVEPEPVAHPALADRALDLLADRAHPSAPGGGMSNAVQYWFSIVIVPASTVSSIS